MRILVVSSTYLPSWGGAERLIYEVALRLSARHEIRVVAPHPPAEAVSEHASQLLNSAPFETHLYKSTGRLDRLRGRRFHHGVLPPVDLSSLRTVWNEARDFEPDAILAFYAIPTGFAAIATARRRRARSVLAFIGRDVPGPGVPRAWRVYDRFLARASDTTAYISEYCRTALFRPDEFRPERECIIAGGVDRHPEVSPAASRAWRQRLGLADETKILLCLQRLARYKGVDVLVRSMTALQEENCVLVVAGSGSDRDRLEELALELGLTDRVLFVGFVPEADLPLLWSAADIFVFHSFYETFGLAVAEAMAAGKPIVTIDSTAVAELVEHRQSGLLAEPGDHLSIARYVVEFLSDPALAASCGAEAQRRSETFSWDAIAAQYEQALSGGLRYEN